MYSSLEQRYLEFGARSDAVFSRYPQVEPLRYFVFQRLLVQRNADGLKDHVKHWLRPLLRRARTRRAERGADVLMWLESRRMEGVETLVPVYRELVARGVGVELVSFEGPTDLPVPSRRFEFPARARAPSWAQEAWEGLCECEAALRGRALARSFYHACATLQGLYDEVHRVLEASAPKVVLCASTQLVGGAALMAAARLRGIGSLLLQHGMLGWNYLPLPADLTLTWGPSSEEVLVSLGVPRARLLAVGSPRHDFMRPSGNGHARATLLRALGLSAERPTFVFFSQGSDLGHAAVESARWLEELAAQYANALNVVVRLHPNEDGALYRGCSHLTMMHRAVELSVALDGCDWIGSISSTALYDALLYGKQPWQFCADHWPVDAQNWRQGLALRVSSGHHLSELVRAGLSQGATAGVDETLVRRVFANHGRATRAVADVVVSCLNPSGARPRVTAVEPAHVGGA
jgi:hypothetical protein